MFMTTDTYALPAQAERPRRTGPDRSVRDYQAVGRKPAPCARRWRSKITGRRACRTPARPSGTSPTPAGSSSASSCRSTCPAIAAFIPASIICSTPTIRASARSSRAICAACSRARRSPRSIAIATTSMSTWCGCSQSEAGTSTAVAGLVELGLNHEQQHQELLLTDIKHLLFLQSAASGLSAAPAARHAQPHPARVPRPLLVARVRRRPAPHRCRRAAGLLLRQRDAAPSLLHRHRSRWPIAWCATASIVEFVRDGGYRRLQPVAVGRLAAGAAVAAAAVLVRVAGRGVHRSTG